MKFKSIYKYLILIFLVLITSSCQKEDISIIVPYGSPSYATMYLEQYDISIVQGADPLVAAFGSSNYDVIVAPTNLGAKFYLSSETYQLAGTIVWGNMYLISQTPIDIDTLDDMDIYAFGQNQTPDIILNYIFDAYDVNPNITYLSSASESVASFILNPNEIYLVAEPQYSILESDYALSCIDLQNAYESISGLNPYPQASIFVHKSLSDQTVENIKKDFEASINKLNQLEDETFIASKLALDEEIISNVIERSHISYMDALDAKTDIKLYLNLIVAFNDQLLSACPKDTFYR
jgi:NitT/TauT family transport system substrate-binding protein